MNDLPCEILGEINKHLSLSDMKKLLLLNKKISQNIYVKQELLKYSKLDKEEAEVYISTVFNDYFISSFYIPYFNINNVIDSAFQTKKSSDFILSLAKYYNTTYSLNVFEIIHLSIKHDRLDVLKYINDINNYDDLLIFDINQLLIESYRLKRISIIEYLLHHKNKLFINDNLLKYIDENNVDEIDKLYKNYSNSSNVISSLNMGVGSKF